VHAHSWAGGLAALAGAGGLPVVQSHQLPEPSALGPQRLRLERAIGRSVRSVIAACTAEREELVRLGVARPSIHVVPEGVDVGRFAPKGPSCPRGDRARLLMLSLHGVEMAISALPSILEAELVVAGGPPREELEADPQVHRLRILAKELGVGDRVVFLGRITRPEVPSLVRSVDLVLALPRHDPYGTIAVEAMACGIPVVATAVGGNLDTVVDGVTGLLVPPGHPRALATKVRMLLADPVRQVAYGIAGADRAAARHAWERVAAETVRTYERALLPA
jgi:glycosyltransferase involved in cell wall biosynthesis